MIQYVYLAMISSNLDLGGMRPLSSIPELRGKTLRVGTKQTLRAVELEQAQLVYVADDVDTALHQQITALAKLRNVQIVRVDSMISLGRACGIDVGAAMVAVLKYEAPRE